MVNVYRIGRLTGWDLDRVNALTLVFALLDSYYRVGDSAAGPTLVERSQNKFLLFFYGFPIS